MHHSSILAGKHLHRSAFQVLIKDPQQLALHCHSQGYNFKDVGIMRGKSDKITKMLEHHNIGV